MKFNPEEYETVKSRKEKFYKDYPNGRIIVEIINQEQILTGALLKAIIYLTLEEQEKNLPKSTGYAFEIRDTELSISRAGDKYESVNYSSWTENAEESAIGRALDNAGYSGNKKPSREEMEKASRMNDKMRDFNSSAPITGYCSVCGEQGRSGKYGAYCPNYKREDHYTDGKKNWAIELPKKQLTKEEEKFFEGME